MIQNMGITINKPVINLWIYMIICLRFNMIQTQYIYIYDNYSMDINYIDIIDTDYLLITLFAIKKECYTKDVFLLVTETDIYLTHIQAQHKLQVTKIAP